MQAENIKMRFKKQDLSIWLLVFALLILLPLLIFSDLSWLSTTQLDWRVYSDAASRVLRGEPLYGAGEGYFYAPWSVFAFMPFLIFHPSVGGLVFALTSTAIGLVVAKRYGLSTLNCVLLLTSPPAVACYFYGQADLFFLMVLLAPVEWRYLLAITKPQLTLGLAFAVPFKYKIFEQAAFIAVGVLICTVIWFGVWPIDLLAQALPGNLPHNIMQNLWPFSILFGAILILRVFPLREPVDKEKVPYNLLKKHPELLALAASPFLMPYAMINSFIGVWLAMIVLSKKSWHVPVLYAVFWGSLLLRLL